MPGVLLEKPQASGGEEATPMEVKEAGSEEAQAAVKEPTKNDAPASRSTVGIIYPPPEVRNIVDKTADFVARNGPEFEERIKLNEAGNSKFNFLNRTDPYHAYYQHKIEEIKEGVVQEQIAAQQLGYIPPVKQTPITILLDSEVPRDPPPEFEFVVEPPSISAMELDIVKLTGQFVARNGASFLDELMMREQRNYQFDFLRKQHPLFVYFTKLVEQYSKVLLPAYNTLPNLKKTVMNPALLIEQSQHRMLWEQYQKKQRQKVEEEEEKKRVEYAQIDWHDFVIVETINFRENEAGYLPPPIRPSQLAQRLLQQSKFDRLAEDGGEVEEIEMEVDEQDNQGDQATPTTGAGDARKPERPKQGDSRVPAKPPSPPPSQPPIQPKGPVQVRRGYDPKSTQPQPALTGAGQFLISPITGEKIPAEKMEEHMKYGLLDPRWTEEKKKQIAEKKAQDEVYAEGVHIGSSLKRLAERRTDIFGMEETMIGQKIGEEEAAPRPGVQWDGHSGSSEGISREAQANIGEQLKAIERAKEQAEKEKFGPTLLKTPINSAPPARPPSHQGGPPRGPPLQMQRGPPQQRPPHMGQQPPMGIHPDMRPHPQMQMMPPPMMGSQGHPMMPHPHHPHGMMQLPNSAPPLPGMAPLMQSHPPPFMQNFPPNMGPPHKRPHLESEDLIPEQEFISKNPGPVTFKVQVPNIPDRSEWKLNGQILSINLPITDFVSVIKAKICDELGMPSGKQKLQIGPVFVKDSLSLGYYNISPNTVVLLGLKERGGRKK